MEGKTEETGQAEDTPAPSVAKLAGIFGDQVNCPKKEAPPHKPTRRKPPCSLPLPTNKPESAQNNHEKVSPQAPHLPKIKVKSSPLIEKLQANLAFAPASLLPGAVSPKSPGLKVMASPFSSPPSTPSSPGGQSRFSESDETPVSFEQPPEGAHLQSFTKVRTRGSIKRRPPSRRFRKSQSDIGSEGDILAGIAPKENGDKEDEGDEVFSAKATSQNAEDVNKTPKDKSVESSKDGPEKHEAHRDAKEPANEDGLEDKEEQPDSVQEGDKNEATEKTTGETDPQEVPKQPNITINIEDTSGQETVRPDQNKEGRSGEEEKNDPEK
ncbi:capZ-interacting protein [Spea bombifrons]|uniref:capZ-interacting protein n=1 Tax=Spea bombifrons TaxID=233779 RepID=UPI002349A982|nr:capZ-interacting protein [Spea bombifrons]